MDPSHVKPPSCMWPPSCVYSAGIPTPLYLNMLLSVPGFLPLEDEALSNIPTVLSVSLLPVMHLAGTAVRCFGRSNLRPDASLSLKKACRTKFEDLCVFWLSCSRYELSVAPSYQLLFVPPKPYHHCAQVCRGSASCALTILQIPEERKERSSAPYVVSKSRSDDF